MLLIDYVVLLLQSREPPYKHDRFLTLIQLTPHTRLRLLLNRVQPRANGPLTQIDIYDIINYRHTVFYIRYTTIFSPTGQLVQVQTPGAGGHARIRAAARGVIH
jgi:hypothetical protein